MGFIMCPLAKPPTAVASPFFFPTHALIAEEIY